MNILFDLITTYKITGASEYVRRVFYSLLKKRDVGQFNIICVFDSHLGISAYPDLSTEANKQRGIVVEDIHYKCITKIVSDNQIDKVFIGCAQFWGHYRGLEKLKCEVFCVVHDLSYEEKSSNFIDLWMQMYRSNLHFAWNWMKSMVKGAPFLDLMKPYISLMKSNSQCNIIAVSDYTSKTLQFNFNIDSSHIVVLFSPERIFINKTPDVKNKNLKKLIDQKKKYFLLLHANRPMKNAEKAVRAFMQYEKKHPDIFLVTLGAYKQRCNNHVALPFLDESDLANAYANCYAFIYPSLFEGFGYPPLEAMHYGKPVLSSNVCSMPEVLEDAPIYFSPFYDSDIFRAMCSLTPEVYERLSEASLRQYDKVRKKQEADLDKLIKLIVK